MSAHDEEQSLRKEVLRNDALTRQQSAGHGTFFSHAIAESESVGGRYAAADVSKASVTGSTAVPQYPRQPSIPWPHDPDPLLYEIDAMEPTGSEAEIEAAAQILEQRSAADTADDGSDDVPVALPSAVELSEPSTKSSDVSFGRSATGPATQLAPTDEVAGPTPFQSPDALQTTPATRAPASNDEVRRDAGARTFQRRI
jgi:hypothetical protein